jgi:hypothetical protein
MARHLGLTEKNDQKRAKEIILGQANGQALIRSQHFMPYRQVEIRSFTQRLKMNKTS